MPSATHLTTAGSTTDGTSFDTASITLAADRLGLCAVFARTSVTIPTATIAGWTQVLSINHGAAGKLQVFRRLAGTPATGTLTIDFGATTVIACCWSVSEFDDVPTTGTNGADAVGSAPASDTGTGTSGLVALAFDAAGTSATYGVFGHNANEVTVEGAGFTLLGTAPVGTPNTGIGAEWRVAADTSVDASWATSTLWSGIAIEVLAPTGEDVEFDGTSDAAADASGDLHRDRGITGQTDTAGIASGVLAVARRLVGEANAAGDAIAELTVTGPSIVEFDGTSDSAADTSGLLVVVRELAGTSDAVGDATGALTVGPSTPTTLITVGDSVASQVGAHLGAALSGLNYTVANRAVGGTGPAYDAFPPGLHWVGSTPGLLAARLADNPNAVLCGFGGRSFVLTPNGFAFEEPLSPRWWQKTVRGTRVILRTCREEDREVWWLIYPSMKKGQYATPAEVFAWTYYRAWCRQEVGRFIPADHIIDLSPWLSPGDKWTKRVAGEVVRAPDRIHLTDFAARLAAQVVGSAISTYSTL